MIQFPPQRKVENVVAIVNLKKRPRKFKNLRKTQLKKSEHLTTFFYQSGVLKIRSDFLPMHMFGFPLPKYYKIKTSSEAPQNSSLVTQVRRIQLCFNVLWQPSWLELQTTRIKIRPPTWTIAYTLHMLAKNSLLPTVTYHENNFISFVFSDLSKNKAFL